MRWHSVILDLALMVAVWTVVLRLVHQRRARMAADAPPHAGPPARLQGLFQTVSSWPWCVSSLPPSIKRGLDYQEAY
jgi:hypothetical protein